MLTSATRGDTLTPNPNEFNSTHDRGHWFRSGSPLTNYPHTQASPELLGKHNACALRFREVKKNSYRSRRRLLKQKSSKLELSK